MFNLSSCTSQSSTAIISSNMDLPPLLPSSSSSSSTSSSTSVTHGRALDRHNPIITDDKRSGISAKPDTPPTNHVLQQKPKPKPKTPTLKITNCSIKNNNNNQNSITPRKSLRKPSELIMKTMACNTSKPGVDYITPSESSRYLLDDSSSSFLGFDPVLKVGAFSGNNTSNSDGVELSRFGVSFKPPEVSSSSSPSSDQVVVLRVSLHCRGCETKLKKHLSRMPGVKSFNVDFSAKKVTVVGELTALQVLTSISKVKTAKLWTPTMPMK